MRVALLALLVALAGCESPGRFTGLVSGKQSSPEHVQTYYVQSGDILIPMEETIPAAYSLRVTVSGNVRDVDVSADQYRAINIGAAVRFKCSRFSCELQESQP